MTWIKGEIVEFSRNPRQPDKNKDLRKIRTRPEQPFADMWFFHVRQAYEAGYDARDLRPGQSIEFEPGRGPRGPIVKSFKPQTPTEAARSGYFLNPYHFIPLAPPLEGSLVDIDAVLEGTLHDRFEPNRYSGRMVCRLVTEGPVVIGARQQGPRDEKGAGEEREIRAAPFELPSGQDGEDWPAIPASSLRGLISSLVEAASSSALRVLQDQRYSRRSEWRPELGEVLSATGMLVDDDGQLKLRPLTLPLEEMQKRAPDQKRCRVYLDGYRSDRSTQEQVLDPSSFLGRYQPKSWSASHQEYWYARLDGATWKVKHNRNLGLQLTKPPIPQGELEERVPEEERGLYTRGVLLVLGVEPPKAKSLPPGKKHELFLPVPPEREEEPLLPIDADALETFNELLQSAAEIDHGAESKEYPFLHVGRERDEKLVARAGDLVYYQEAGGVVTRLSYSSIWRSPIPGSLYEAVSTVSPELIPFQEGRKKLTLAERLFGFVEQGGEGRALAGRVRVAHGLLDGEEPAGGWFAPETVLKILASPKPPSPAFYFGQHGYLGKRQLDLSSQATRPHVPQGRKMYLHHLASDVQAECYKTKEEPDKHRKQKMRVQPLKEGLSFYFHLDFDNLTQKELGFLCYALQPAAAFRHKLGLGKPLGLGRVRIEPVWWGFIDRQQSYRPEALFASKYAVTEKLNTDFSWQDLRSVLGERYRHEQAGPAVGSERPSFADLRNGVRKKMNPAVRSALERLGDPSKVRFHVHYPSVQGQDVESEHFQWFVANDKGPTGRGGEELFLGPLLEEEAHSPLPELKILDSVQRKRR